MAGRGLAASWPLRTSWATAVPRRRLRTAKTDPGGSSRNGRCRSSRASPCPSEPKAPLRKLPASSSASGAQPRQVVRWLGDFDSTSHTSHTPYPFRHQPRAAFAFNEPFVLCSGVASKHRSCSQSSASHIVCLGHCLSYNVRAARSTPDVVQVRYVAVAAPTYMSPRMVVGWRSRSCRTPGSALSAVRQRPRTSNSSQESGPTSTDHHTEQQNCTWFGR